MKDWIKYWLLGIIFWFVVDFLTTDAILNFSYYNGLMPALLIVYVGYPLLFSFFIFKFNIRRWKLFIASVIAFLVLEMLMFGTASLILQYAFILIPIGTAYYVMITMVPLWIVEHRLKENKKWFILVLIVSLIGITFNILTQIGVWAK